MGERPLLSLLKLTLNTTIPMSLCYCCHGDKASDWSVTEKDKSDVKDRMSQLLCEKRLFDQRPEGLRVDDRG